MQYSTISYQVDAGIALITFNRPEKRNALNPVMMEEIDAALSGAEGDEKVAAVILTGGPKCFISGTDIDFLLGDGPAPTPQKIYEMHHATQAVYRHLADFAKPSIAALAGFAFGGGLELALCCDFRIAAENTKLGTPEIKLGILPGAGGTQRLTRLIGLTKAKELVLTGEPILAQDAYPLGLLNKVVPLEKLMDEACAFAARFKDLPAFAVRMAKAVMDTGIDMSLKEALEVERLGFCVLYSTEDQKEGLKAFREKRPPKYQGK
jgi:enoyl-CoA hydratase